MPKTCKWKNDWVWFETKQAWTACSNEKKRNNITYVQAEQTDHRRGAGPKQKQARAQEKPLAVKRLKRNLIARLCKRGGALKELSPVWTQHARER